MKVKKSKLLIGVYIFGLLTNLLVLFNFNYLYLQTTFTTFFLLAVPGLLIMLILKIKKIGFWEYLVYVFGLSVAFLIFFGLGLNWLLPFLGIVKPLTVQPILTGLNMFLLTFWLIAYEKNKNNSLKLRLTKPSLLNVSFFATPFLFPLLSILGAISLNNNGTNLPTVIMLGTIAVYVFLMVLFRKRLNKNIYPLAIFFIALSLLLMTSLRGWYITGHDVMQEYLVFQLARTNGVWNISRYRDPYNASLSITILPTLFSSLLNINDMYIYKVIFQIIFSFTAVSTYLFFNKYTDKSIAFLSVFYFVSFPTFLNDMPMLNRQEMSLLFFSLMLLVLFKKTAQMRTKNILFSTFALAMIVAHYSTSYVAVALIILTYVLSMVLKFNILRTTTSFNKALKHLPGLEKVYTGRKKYFLTLNKVLLVIIFTFLWNTRLASASGGLGDLVSQTFQNINKSFSRDLKSGDVLYSLFTWQKLDTQQLMDEYVQTNTMDIQLEGDKDDYFEESLYEDHDISVVGDGVLASEVSFDTFSFNYNLRQFSAKLIQIFIALGFLALFLKKRKYISKLDFEYNIFVLAGIILLALLITLPLFSIEYGTLRFFQQNLIILSLPATVGVLTVLSFLGKRTSLYISTGIFIIFFLSLSGFIPQVLGGYYPQLHLNNQGVYYDSYYTHKSELVSMNWLASNLDDNYPIQSNEFASSKVLTYADLNSSGKILPLTIRKDAYVYLDYSNVRNVENTISYKGGLIIYNYPIEFLNDNKDLIYSNSGAKIFK